MDEKKSKMMITRWYLIDGWWDSLIWCPSQCTYKFYIVKDLTKIYYCIYLRWRHHDPWEGSLILTDEDGNKLEITELKSPNNFTQESNLNSLKKAVIEEVKEYLQ